MIGSIPPDETAVTNPLAPHGAVPTFVPPHLQGKVWDFRNEPDGKISFQHHEASNGLSGDAARVTMTPEEYKLNFDKATRLGQFDKVLEKGYDPIRRTPKTAMRELNDSIASKLSGALNWGTSNQGKAVGTAGLLAALAGGVGGYMWGRDQDESPIKRALLMALLAGGVGAAGTAWMQNKHNRREAYLAGGGPSQMGKQAATDWTPLIIRMLENDPSLNSGTRAMLLRAIINANPNDQEDLYRLLRTATGAGVGVLAMRFLGSKGLLPMIAGGILGGILGSSFGGGPRRNALGQVSITDYM